MGEVGGKGEALMIKNFVTVSLHEIQRNVSC